MDNKPYKDYICPRCKHNVGYRQQYCGICGLQLDWSEQNDSNLINYISYPIAPTERTTATPIKECPPAIITC